MKDCLFSGLVGCGRFHQFGYRILAALSWGSTIDTHPLRDMNRAGGGKHPAVSEVHRARDLLFAHCEPDDLTVVSVLRGWLDRGDKPGVSSGPAVSRNGFGAAHVQSPLVILLDACLATRPVSALQIHSKADRPIGSTCRPWPHPRNYGEQHDQAERRRSDPTRDSDVHRSQEAESS